MAATETKNTPEEEQKLLEIEGTDPEYWNDIAWLSDDRLSRVVVRLDDYRLSRIVARLDDYRLSRIVARLDDADLSRIVAIRDSIPSITDPYSAVISVISRDGCKLDMTAWHSCETTHCLAGWIVTLANGEKLESKLDTPLAAKLILLKSTKAPLPNFYASDEAATAFIEARAKEEALARHGR